MRFLLLIFICTNLFAQDTITFRNKEIKVVKVFEISASTVKYHSFDNLEGPTYIADKNEIQFIKYPNGKIDTFNITPPKVETPSDFNAYKNRLPDKIQIHGKRLSFEGRGLSEGRMLKLIVDYPFPQTKSLMLKEFTKVKGLKGNRRLGFGVLAVGIFSQLAGLRYGNGSLFLGGAAIGIVGTVVANVNKNKCSKKKVEIARMYNDWK